MAENTGANDIRKASLPLQENKYSSPRHSHSVEALAMRKQSAPPSRSSKRSSMTSSRLSSAATSSALGKFLQNKTIKESRGHNSTFSTLKAMDNMPRIGVHWKKVLQNGNAKKLKQINLKRKIRIAVRLSLFLRHWWYKHLKAVDNMVLSDDKLDFLTKLIKPSAEEEKPKDILFDASAFKAKKHQKIPLEAKRILTVLPQYRTDSEIHYVMIALRAHKQIANCPVRMQRLIAKYGELESFDEKRCIVKQGHPPQAFYYIFYGTVAVTVDDGPEKKVMCVLGRGESFGELAIVSETERQSSVISETEIELISIKKVIYEKVFMVGGSKKVTDPDHEEFIKSLDFLDDFPTHLLDINPKSFVFTYFQRGAVMVKDSNYSEWLYVIKSGSVNVLKKLVKSQTAIDEKTGKKRRRPQANKDKFESFICGQYSNYCRDHSIPLPQPLRVDEHSGEIIKKERTTNRFPHIMNRRRRSLSAPGRQTQSLEAVRRANTNFSQDSLPTVRWKRSIKDVVRSNSRVTLAQLVRKHVVITSEGEEEDGNMFDDDYEIACAKTQEFCPPSELLPPSADEKRTYLDDLDKGFERRAHLLTEADLNPQFVKVQTLTKGSTFGLADVVLMDQPSLCLVSNGAECIMINKDFYREHCTQKLQRKLLQIVSPYPEDELMQERLVAKLNWEAQKKAILNHTVTDIQHHLLRVSKASR